MQVFTGNIESSAGCNKYLFLLKNESLKNISIDDILNSIIGKKFLNIHSTNIFCKYNKVGFIASSIYDIHIIEQKIKECLNEINEEHEKQMEIIEEYDGQVKVYNEW